MTYSAANDVQSSPEAETTEICVEENPAQQVVMPDIYGNARPAVKSRLHVVSHASSDVDASTGFNPYDTGVLQQTKLKR